MNIFKCSSKNKFIDEVIDFITENYKDNFPKLKILLPNGLTCSELQQALIKTHGTIILPNIIPISELVAEEEEIFKIPSGQIGAISRLEEKLTLAEVISSYKDLDYDLSQSLRLSPSLAQLFFEFETNNLEFKDIKHLPKLDESEHWNMIYNFLKFAQDKWLSNIKKMQKISRGAYQDQIFKAEINRLMANPDESLIIAGVVGNNKITNEFIRKALELSNVNLILPPFDESAIKNQLPFENPLYKIQKFVSNLENKKINIKTLGRSNESIFDKLLYNSSADRYEDNLEYVELENAFCEAEYIALKCKKQIEDNAKCKIAILAHSQETKEQCSLFLEKYELQFTDLFGKDILTHPAISLILLISELQYSKFSLHCFFAFLSHSEIANDKTLEIKNIIRKHNRLASNLESIAKTINQYATQETNDEFSNLVNFIEASATSNKFHHLLKHTLQTVEKILPNIWKKYSDINAPLSEIINKEWKIQITDIDTFPELLKQILEGGRILESRSNCNIIICKPHDTALINYDLIIISDLNENKYPKSVVANPWLNLQMQKELELDSKISDIGNKLYEFYLNINNKKIILTRAKKSAGMQTIQSPFILHLKYILGNRFVSKIAAKLNTRNIEYPKDNCAKSDIFPKQISATDIETLIRSPYNFYIKKILKIRKIDEISDKPNLADFGNFFHQIAEEYTNHFPEKLIEDLSDKYLEEIDIPQYSKNAWKTKIMAIAPELIDFEEKRRKLIQSVHCEIKGTLELNIKGKKLTILAIADRIEVGKQGKAYIMDYKTGAIPTKKDIISGLSPQLIIESIILSENGFNLPVNKIEKIIYIKINSHSPYIKTTEIELSKEDISKHKQGLITLLEHYITTNQYPIEPCIMKYDDYTHFARRV